MQYSRYFCTRDSLFTVVSTVCGILAAKPRNSAQRRGNPKWLEYVASATQRKPMKRNKGQSRVALGKLLQSCSLSAARKSYSVREDWIGCNLWLVGSKGRVGQSPMHKPT
jgi:hypothetical protein